MTRLLKSLGLLARLEKDAIDQLRLQVSAVDAKIDDTRAQIENIEIKIPSERILAESLESAITHVSYFESAKTQWLSLKQELSDLEKDRAELMDQIRDHFMNQKSNEKVVERIKQQKKDKMAKSENQQLDAVGLQMQQRKT